MEKSSDQFVNGELQNAFLWNEKKLIICIAIPYYDFCHHYFSELFSFLGIVALSATQYLLPHPGEALDSDCHLYLFQGHLILWDNLCGFQIIVLSGDKFSF